MCTTTRRFIPPLLFMLVGCSLGPEGAPYLQGTWYVRGTTQVAYREHTPCFFTPGPCYQDSIARQCEWSVTLSLAGATGGYEGTYRDASSACSDGYEVPTSGSAAARSEGDPFRLGPSFPEYWPVTVQLGALAIPILLDGSLVPPDSMYGASQFDGYAPVCVGVGWCSRGSFVASQRAMPVGPLGM